MIWSKSRVHNFYVIEKMKYTANQGPVKLLKINKIHLEKSSCPLWKPRLFQKL